jgi:hypothetical protein
MDIKRTLLLAALALTGFEAQAACTNYAVTTTPLAEAPVEVQARGQLPNVDFMGYMTARAVVSKDETACTVSIGYDSTVIYIAKDVAANECTKAHVLAHEREHEAIYNRGLAAVNGTSVSSVEAILDSIREAQAAHDTPEEYETNLNVCNKRMRAFVRGRR